MTSRRVVVTGLGALTPLGNDVPSFWENCIAGISGAAEITKFDASKFKTRFACEVKGFDIERYVDKKEARKLDPFVHYAIAASDDAIADSGIDFKAMEAHRAGVIWASGIGGLHTFYEEVTAFATGDGTPRFNPFFIPKMIIDLAAGHISIRHGLQGVNFSIVSACASSTHAIGEAFTYIKAGKADVIVTGGSEAAITPPGIGGFNAMKALSTRNESPATASRPFDATRDGFVMGEGGICLILEEYEHAMARGAKVYAELVGYGATADAYHITAPHPDGDGANMVMRTALKEAGLEPSDLDYVNVHGTSTPLGDVAELKAIRAVFGDHAFALNVSSTKSMTGHLLGAAGAIELMACVLAVKHNVVPPTINHQVADEQIDPRFNLTLNHKQERTVNYALSNTFGFGGHNASVIVKKFGI
ncbi:MAG: beta-ketoacyl-ACP synthase II [Bacteroidetes bacterium]|jgi:3-oxoacyl-[acyl-carrier-protein] synthase II|nr:beta-ketoacyl-ACP synthase II [Bacteroidota bacterium]